MCFVLAFTASCEDIANTAVLLVSVGTGRSIAWFQKRDSFSWKLYSQYTLRIQLSCFEVDGRNIYSTFSKERSALVCLTLFRDTGVPVTEIRKTFAGFLFELFSAKYKSENALTSKQRFFSMK